MSLFLYEMERCVALAKRWYKTTSYLEEAKDLIVFNKLCAESIHII